MTKKTSNSPLDLVTALMQERLKFETWITTLEQRRDATPANVYERVHKDYKVRLAAVLTELKTHATELEAQAERFTRRLVELTEQEQHQRDERAEAELRALVGELSEQDWNSTAKQADDALASVAAEQAVVGADLNRVHELLGAATGSAATAPAPAAPSRPESILGDRPKSSVPSEMESMIEAPASDSLAEPPTTKSAPASPPPQVPAPKPPEQTSFDELAFLKSVVSPAGSRAPVDQGRPAQPEAPAEPASPPLTAEHSDGLADSLVSRVGRPSQVRAFARDDVDETASQLVGRADDPAAQPFAANVTGNHPIVLRPSGAIEQPKTLKCGECGAVNYPTEWYCERCGAELASL